MKRIDPTKMLVGGDKTKAKGFLGPARSQMEILKQQMSFQNLKQGVRRVWLHKDVYVECIKCFNYQECRVWVQPLMAEEEPVGGCWSAGIWMEGQILGKSLVGWQDRTNSVFLDDGKNPDLFRTLYADAGTVERLPALDDQDLWEDFVHKQYPTHHLDGAIAYDENGFISNIIFGKETVDINIVENNSVWNIDETEPTSVATINKTGEFVELDGLFPYVVDDYPCASSLYTVEVCMNGTLRVIHGVFGNNFARYEVGQPVVVCKIEKEQWGDGGAENPYYMISPFVLSNDYHFKFSQYQSEEDESSFIVGTQGAKLVKKEEEEEEGDVISAGIRISPSALAKYQAEFVQVEEDSISEGSAEVECRSAGGTTLIGNFPVVMHTNQKYYDYIARDKKVPVSTSYSDCFLNAANGCIKRPEINHPYHYNAGYNFTPGENKYYGEPKGVSGYKWARHGSKPPHDYSFPNWYFYQTDGVVNYYLLTHNNEGDGAVIAKTDEYHLPIVESEWKKYLCVRLGHDIPPLPNQAGMQGNDKFVIWNIQEDAPAKLLNAAGDAYISFPCDAGEITHWLLVARGKETIYKDGAVPYGDWAACPEQPCWEMYNYEWHQSETEMCQYNGALHARPMNITWLSPLTGEEEVYTFEPTCSDSFYRPYYYDPDNKQHYRENTISWVIKDGSTVIDAGLKSLSLTLYESDGTYRRPGYPDWPVDESWSEGAYGEYCGDIAKAEDDEDGFKAAYLMVKLAGGVCPFYQVGFIPSNIEPNVHKMGISLDTIVVSRYNGSSYEDYPALKTYLEDVLSGSNWTKVLQGKAEDSGVWYVDSDDGELDYMSLCSVYDQDPPRLNFTLIRLPHSIPLGSDL